MQMDMSKIFGGPVAGGSTATKQKGASGIRPDDKVGILFLNLGGPEKLDEVEDFLFNLFNDEDIIRLPNPVKPLQGETRVVGARPRVRARYDVATLGCMHALEHSSARV